VTIRYVIAPSFLGHSHFFYHSTRNNHISLIAFVATPTLLCVYNLLTTSTSTLTAILRILHRHSTRPITSSFLPQSCDLISNTIQPSASPTSLQPPMSFIRHLIRPPCTSGRWPIPYPEWRKMCESERDSLGWGSLQGNGVVLGGVCDYSRAKARQR